METHLFFLRASPIAQCILIVYSGTPALFPLDIVGW